jgi:hypothetical protein
MDGSAALRWTEQDAQEAAAPPHPPLRNEHVVLRPPVPGDYDMLRLAEMSTDVGLNWRLRGHTPGPEEWAANLWSGVLAQHLVFPIADGPPLGLLVAYRASLQDGFSYLAALKFDPNDRSPLFLQGLALFTDFLFATWNFHKLYMEVPAYNMQQFASGVGRYLEIEGRFKEHLSYAGRRWDLLMLALYRERWQQHGARAVAAGARRLVVRMPARPGA